MNRRTFIAMAATGLLPVRVQAKQLAPPAADVILTVGGSISNSNRDNVLEFDLAMLKQLPGVTVTTTTPWTQGATKFEGVALRDIIAAAGGAGKSIYAIAINDYTAEIPMEDALQHGAFVAYAMNGEEMSVRDKGPLWILYPFDDRPELKAEGFYARCVWQLKALSISL